MNNSSTVRTGRRRIAAAFALAAVALACLTGAYAIHNLLARPGEAALRYVPADAVLVASIDLVPSPTQVLAFKHIDDSLSRNSLEKDLQGSIIESIDSSKAAAALKPLVQRSGAVCMLPYGNKPNDYSGLIFFAVSDGAQARTILQEDASPRYYKGFKYYMTGKSKMGFAVVDDLLVLTDRPEEFLKVVAIQNGTAQPITSDAGFVAARKMVADDANIVAFCSPKLFSGGATQAAGAYPVTEWSGFGLAIRDGGIGFSAAGKMDMSKHAEYQAVCQVPPLRSDLFDVLPTGSYGMIAISDPSGYFDFVNSAVNNGSQSRKAMADFEDGVQSGIGLSVKKDLIPAFQGDAIAAAYPSQDGEAAGADLLVVIDDTNAATPADAADRMESFIEQQTAKEGKAPKMFEQKPITGGREFAINDKDRDQFRKVIGEVMLNSGIKNDLMASKKTFAFALVGKAVLAASSQELLDRAIACYESKTGGLVGDAKFASAQNRLMDGSQVIAAFSVSRIAEGMKNTVNTSKMDANGRKLFDGILGAFSTLNEPFTIQTKTTADGVSSGGVFIPMDYDKIIDLIGSQMHKK